MADKEMFPEDRFHITLPAVKEFIIGFMDNSLSDYDIRLLNGIRTALSVKR